MATSMNKASWDSDFQKQCPIISWADMIASLTALLDKHYHNDPKFLDRYTWANNADPHQTAPLIRVYTVCHSICIIWTHYSMVEPHSSNFRVITTNILGVRIFRKFMILDKTGMQGLFWGGGGILKDLLNSLQKISLKMT